MGSKQMASELKPGDKVESYFSISYTKPVTEYKYGFMFEVRAVDVSGQVTVKYWGGSDKESVSKVHGSFGKDDVVRIVGEAVEYRGLMEISVSEKDGGTISRLDEGEYDISNLVKRCDDIEGMKSRLVSIKDSVNEPSLRRLLDAFFDDPAYMEEFGTCPASIQLHSAAIGGLLRHTLNVAETCAKIVELHPELDRDLVMAGALLHDIGKVRSLKVTSNIGQTREGNLLGHIALGDEDLTAKVSTIGGMPEDLELKLRHVLLSHHGRKDWGSPVEPMLPEALAVHEADDLDAKIDYMISRREGAVTDDDWIWDSRLSRLIYLG